jgi:hypothetical protein
VPVSGDKHRSEATSQRKSATIRKGDPAMLSFEPANRSPEIRGHIIALPHPEQQNILNSTFRGSLSGGAEEVVIHLAKI